MATINFLYRSTRPRSELTLRLLFRNEGIDHVCSAKTKLEVTKLYWENNHNKKRLKDIELINHQTAVNNEITNITNHVLNCYKMGSPNEITKQWLLNCLHQYYNPHEEEKSLPTNLHDYFDYFLACKKREITDSSIRKYSVVRNLLLRYQSTLNRQLRLIDIDLKFKHNFEAFCDKLKYSPNTIAWAIRSIKTICNHAKFNGLETNAHLDNIKTNSFKTPKIYLSFSELNHIENLSHLSLGESLGNARDWLMISCFTGQRISDFMAFSSNNIRSENGHSLLEFTQQKTNKLMTIHYKTKC